MDKSAKQFEVTITEHLKALLMLQKEEQRQQEKNRAWKRHTQIVRGNPVRVYSGMKFERQR